MLIAKTKKNPINRKLNKNEQKTAFSFNQSLLDGLQKGYDNLKLREMTQVSLAVVRQSRDFIFHKYFNVFKSY